MYHFATLGVRLARACKFTLIKICLCDILSMGGAAAGWTRKVSRLRQPSIVSLQLRPLTLSNSSCDRASWHHAVTVILAGGVIGGLLLCLATRQAYADCQPNPPAGGATVICAGPAPTTIPVNAPAATDVTVNINTDATITGTGPLIFLGESARISNNGSIQVTSTGSGDIGIIAGTIATSGFNSLSAFSIGDNVVLRNEVGAQISIVGDLAAGLLIGGGSNSSCLTRAASR
jgi:hypothetical protein